MNNDDEWGNLPKGNFWSWNQIGDHLTGTITAKSIGRDFNGQDCPQLSVETDDGQEFTLTAGQAQLKAKLIEAKPKVGDKIRISFVGTEKRAQGELKQFDVSVKAGAPVVEEAW